MKKEYEAVIGLEVHIELLTKTKIFCGCATDFGASPNTQICPVCTGMPGALPVLNRRVVELALKAGLATHCKVHTKCKFDRKNYFYPDNPQNYQISQLYSPICYEGWLDIETEQGKKKIRIHEMHMEEDAGKLIHDEWKDCTLVDYNRSGVPLIEIVSEPDMRNSGEVIAYLEKLRDTMRYLGVSDCKLQEGSMRVDVNLSVRPKGSEAFGVRTEMKNLNSFKAIVRAIEGEKKRQIELLESGHPVLQETRRWDDNKEYSYAMRSKEEARDYRYFPDPDLPPVLIGREWIRQIQKTQPELREEKIRRFQSEFGLGETDAAQLTQSKHLADLFEETAVISRNPKKAANWFLVDTLRLVKEKGIDVDQVQFTPKHLADLILVVEKGEINNQSAREVFEKIFENDVDPLEYIREKGIGVVQDLRILEKILERVLTENEESVIQYRNGKEKIFGFLVGQVMKELKGKGNPKEVNRMLKEKLGK